ncbi:MAG: PA2778 family cysteine peptidase [Deltaproteobacteria bacterium]|nr:MAG: PA2778 family cysteine peptidase [Deltaproteobacteria bacterium]
MPVPVLRRGKTGIISLVLFVSLTAGCAHISPERYSLSVSGHAGRVEIPSVPFYPQRNHHCGPAAMAMVLQWATVKVSPEELVSEVFTPSRQGSLQSALIGAARRHDRLAHPIRGAEELLTELTSGHPVLVLQNLGLSWLPRWHYAVAIGYDTVKGVIILHSGKDPSREVNWRLFMRTWRRVECWGLVVLPPGLLPASGEEHSYMRSALGLEQAGQWEGAALAYGAALRRWPLSLGALMGLGNCRYKLGDLGGAERAFRRATEAHSTSGEAFNNLAHVLAEQGRYDEALQMATQAVDIGGANKSLYVQTLREIQAMTSPGPD